MKRQINYLVWTENLGVVPLFLLAAFLLVPCPLFLFFLIARVCFVLDAIVYILRSLLFLISQRAYFLLKLTWAVKILMLCFAGASLNVTAQHSHFMSRGEQKTIKIKGIQRYSLGNGEILSLKYLAQKGELMVKGKKVGFSDLLIWHGPKKPQVHHIYVVSKREQLKLVKIIESFQTLGLQAQLQGDFVEVSGEIDKRQHYRDFARISQHYQKSILNNATLSPRLRNQLLAEVYQYFIDRGLRHYHCRIQMAQLDCHIASSSQNSWIEDLQKRYWLTTTVNSSTHSRTNFKLRFKVIQVEQLDGEEMSFGLHSLRSPLRELFSSGLVSLIQNNEMVFEKQNLSMSTLAEPEVTTQINFPGTIKVGSQIPYTIYGDNQIPHVLQWRFSGLALKFQIIEKDNRLSLKYKTEFTGPEGDNIKGSSEESSLLIEPNQRFELFTIGYQTLYSAQKKVPLIGDIPILGKIFQSSNANHNYKKIIGMVEVTTEEDKL